MQVDGYEVEAMRRNVLNTLQEMMIDRGYTDVDARDEDIVSSHEAVGVLFGADDVKHRTGIQEVRDIATRFPGRRIIAVSHNGATPYLLSKGTEELDHPVDCFRVQELVRNITKHHLVPKHTVVPIPDVTKVLNQYGLAHVSCLPSLLTSDPVARYHGWEVNTVVRIDRGDLLDNGTVQSSTALRVVVPG